MHDFSQLTVVLVTTVNGLLAQQIAMEGNNLEPESVTTLLLKMGEVTVWGRRQKLRVAMKIHVQVC